MRGSVHLAGVLAGCWVLAGCAGAASQTSSAPPSSATGGEPSGSATSALQGSAGSSAPQGSVAGDAPSSSPAQAADRTPARECLVVDGEHASVPATVEGVLLAAKAPGDAPMMLRLSRPRCVVGLPRASYLTEVAVSTAGPDLRPLLGARVRIRGDALGGENDLGGPALIVLAKDVERLEPTGDP